MLDCGREGFLLGAIEKIVRNVRIRVSIRSYQFCRLLSRGLAGFSEGF